jgi:hypothetical protein
MEVRFSATHPGIACKLLLLVIPAMRYHPSREGIGKLPDKNILCSSRFIPTIIAFVDICRFSFRV